ncbi:MAG: hypothetical protein OXI52_13330, partial [Caldilineaceae bacterium]|nr:hypothetical protein [Caldilineaceae bacterium]
STRGGLPSRPPAAPAWTGYGEGGGRAQGRPGLLWRLCVCGQRWALSDCAGRMDDVLVRTRRGRVWAGVTALAVTLAGRPDAWRPTGPKPAPCASEGVGQPAH